MASVGRVSIPRARPTTLFAAPPHRDNAHKGPTGGDGLRHPFHDARDAMDPSTIIALAAILLPTFGAILTWLWRHSTRLTGAEIRIEGLANNAVEDRRRSDALHQDIRATLTRIEDKLDRKQDRP